jgi:hypothetical protein
LLVPVASTTPKEPFIIGGERSEVKKDSAKMRQDSSAV